MLNPTDRALFPQPEQGNRRLVHLPGPFTFWRGGLLPSVTMAFETWGNLSPRGDNVILLFTGLSPSAHAASASADPSPGWWEFMLGPDKPIDTNKFFVICVNSLGSCFGSSGPASLDPLSARPYGLNFPELSIEDIAFAARELLRELDIEHVHTVIGPSLGGMSALAFALEFPLDVDNLVVISAAAQASAHAIAVRSLQRDIIRKDPQWNDGNYPLHAPPTQGMQLARKLGLISYRTADEWQQRFGRLRMEKPRYASHNSFDPEFEVESYLNYNASKFTGNFDPNCYLYLSRAMDWFDAAEHGRSLKDGLSRLRTRNNLIIGVESDVLFPLWQQEQLANLLPAQSNTRFEALASIQGHDAFLIDEMRFAPLIAQFMQEHSEELATVSPA